MAKKTYAITKYRFVALAVSILLLVGGVVGFFVHDGFNLSIDFQSGFSQRVQIAPQAVEFSYDGNDTLTLNLTGSTLSFVTRDSSGSHYQEFTSSEYPTVGSLVDAINKSVNGVKATALDKEVRTSDLVAGFGLPLTLTSEKATLNSTQSAHTPFITIDEIRDALPQHAQVQIVGEPYKQTFQIRLSNDDNLSESELSNMVHSALSDSFGSGSIVVLQSDFVGPKYSSTLISGSILIVIVAIALILLYIWFRFKLAYALASIITLVHDTLVLVGFIVVFQLEASTTTIAAILTIIGYTLNNVIVIFDRVRENKPLLKGYDLRSLLDTSVSQSFTRTLYSSLTTVFAILPLALLATGAIQLFAIEMAFGIVVGAYSANFLAPALLLWITKEKGPSKVVRTPKVEVAPEVVTEAEPVEQEGGTDAQADVGIPTIERKLKGKRQQKK
jgi:preprotein translocase subunit SecF